MNRVAYNLLALAAIAVGAIFWTRLAHRDRRLLWIYVAALAGGFLGAKLVYLLAEGWLDWGRSDRWLRLATGKSILGGLLGGYVSVRVARAWLGYPNRTGDWFALVVPVGIVIGRIGCLFHGCCLGISWTPSWFTMQDKAGVDRWPAVPAEIAFNLCALALFAWLRWGSKSGTRPRLLQQHFHLYLIGYGLFRFLHDFVRQEPRVLGGFSGYQAAALLVFGLGLTGFYHRSREQALSVVSPIC